MNAASAGPLVELARAVEIRSPADFVIDGVEHVVPPPVTLLEAMKQPLYNFYSRAPAHAQARSYDIAAVRRFTGALSAANTGKGTLEPGWTMVEVDDDGRVGAHKDGLTLWVQAKDFIVSKGAASPGVRGRLRIGKELRELAPGFYFAIGDGVALESDDATVPLVRIYWHILSQGAVPLVAALTERLNHREVPFRLKTINDPLGYGRADSAVLYLDGRDLAVAFPLVVEVYEELKPQLSPEVPWLAQTLAPGLGLAEDPRNGESFGQHRCRVLAEALWSSFQEGHHSTEDRIEAVIAAFARSGLDPARPHVGPGSKQDYSPVALATGWSSHSGSGNPDATMSAR